MLFGDAGTGKSRRAYSMCPELYSKPPGKWWDFYDSQTTVLLDDFSGRFVTFGDFKRWVDRYPLYVEFKGGYLPLLATNWIITTNVHPSTWWSYQTTGEVGLKALYRRISRIEVFRSGHPPQVYDGVLAIESFRSSSSGLEDEHRSRHSNSEFE